MIQHRLVSFLWPVFAFTLGGLLLIALVASWAHADPVAGSWQPAAAPSLPELGLEGRLAAWGVVVYTAARTVLEILKFIAPRTPTKLDDEARDFLAGVLGNARPTEPPRPPTSTSSSALGVLVIGAGLALQPSCGPHGPVGPAAKTALIDCAKADQGPILGFLTELGVALYREVGTDQEVSWTPIEDKAVGRGATIGGCALARFVAELHRDQPAARSLVAGSDSAAAALERVRARLGGVQWQLDGGVR